MHDLASKISQNFQGVTPLDFLRWKWATPCHARRC